MARILKRYDRSIFTITPNFVRVVFPFKSKLKLENGGLNGGYYIIG